MKRELFIHFSFWVFYFVIVAIFKQYFNLASWAFWIGGLIGVILPDIDHVIYVYFVKPTDLSSQRVNYLVNKKDVIRGVSQSRSEESNNPKS